MKTKAEILAGKYIINSSRGEVVFSNDTPRDLAQKMVNLAESKTRVVLDYGDVKTKISWGETSGITGYLSYSRGAYDLLWPIMVYNRRSMGGGSILTDCILTIKESRGKKELYKLK